MVWLRLFFEFLFRLMVLPLVLFWDRAYNWQMDSYIRSNKIHRSRHN